MPKQPDEHPALGDLYATLGAAQAGISARQDEAREDLKKLDAQRADVAKKLKATDDPDEQGPLEDQLAQFDEIEVVLRKSLGDTPEPTTDVARSSD